MSQNGEPFSKSSYYSSELKLSLYYIDINSSKWLPCKTATPRQEKCLVGHFLNWQNQLMRQFLAIGD